MVKIISLGSALDLTIVLIPAKVEILYLFSGSVAAASQVQLSSVQLISVQFIPSSVQFSSSQFSFQFRNIYYLNIQGI